MCVSERWTHKVIFLGSPSLPLEVKGVHGGDFWAMVFRGLCRNLETKYSVLAFECG